MTGVLGGVLGVGFMYWCVSCCPRKIDADFGCVEDGFPLSSHCDALAPSESLIVGMHVPA